MSSNVFPKTLYKFCKREHNIARECKTLRIGTFQYYWGYENEDVGDLKEGIVTLTNKITRTKETVTPQGRFVFTYPAGCKINLMFPNTLIFSVSSSPSIGLADYDDSYSISNLQEFGTSVAMDLFSQIRPRDLDLPDFSMADMAKVDLKWFVHPVVYVPEERFVATAEIEDYAANPDYFEGNHIGLVKRSKYGDQQEYRFLFVWWHPLYGAIQFKHKYFDVSLTSRYGELTVAPNPKEKKTRVKPQSASSRKKIAGEQPTPPSEFPAAKRKGKRSSGESGSN